MLPRLLALQNSACRSPEGTGMNREGSIPRSNDDQPMPLLKKNGISIIIVDPENTLFLSMVLVQSKAY